MGKKFNKIYESVISRGEAGSYLPGDIIVFRKNYKSCDCYKAMPSNAQQEVDELAKCGLNIKIVQVGDNLSGASAGNQFKTSSSVVLTIAADHGGGRTYGRITVSPDMVDMAQVGQFNTAPIPDQFQRKDKKVIKPKKYERDPNFITNVTDKGMGKNTPTSLKLAGESVKPWDDTRNLSLIYESNLKNRVSDSERRKITQKFTQYGLDGNGRFETVGQALNKATQALDEMGLELDMVSNDIEVSQGHHHDGTKGQRLLTYRRKSQSGDPYDQEEEISNSRISFNFENLGRGTGIEVVAYAS